MSDFCDPPEVAWNIACNAASLVPDQHPHDEVGDRCVDAAEDLLVLALQLKGVACGACGGRGRRTYSDTTTWRGGVGVLVLTDDTCNHCWGTRRTGRNGPNLELIDRTIGELRRLVAAFESECRNELARGKIQGFAPDGPHAQLLDSLRDRAQALLKAT